MGTMFPVSAFRKIEFVFVRIYVAIRELCCNSRWKTKMDTNACQVVVLFLLEKKGEQGKNGDR